MKDDRATAGGESAPVDRQRYRYRPLFPPAWVNATAGGFAVVGLAAGITDGSLGMAGIGLMCVAGWASVPVSHWVRTQSDGTRIHGGVRVLTGSVALLFAAMVWVGRADLLDSRHGGALVFLVAPAALVMTAWMLGTGLRLVIAPRPYWLRDRRRRRPKHLPVCAIGEDGPIHLVGATRQHEDAELPRWAVRSIVPVGPNVRGSTAVRITLTRPVQDLDVPWWVRANEVDAGALEFRTVGPDPTLPAWLPTERR